MPVFNPLLGSDLFADSFTKINDSDEAVLTHHRGPTAPVNTFAYQFWADTTANLLKMRNGNNDGWHTVGHLGVAFLGLLSISGGIMSGAIDMGLHQVKNLAVPTDALDAVRKQEHDLKAPLAAPAFTGDATVNQDPNGNNSLIRRIWAEGRYLKTTGGVLTGLLTLSANASSALHPVPLQQLQTYTAFSTTAGHRHTGGDARKVLALDLDAAASVTKQLLRSNGASSAPSWATLLGPAVFLDPPTAINVDTGNGFLASTFQTVDVSSVVPDEGVAVILNVNMEANGFAYSAPTLRFRASGTSMDSVGMSVGPIADGDYRQVLVELSSARVFQWRAAAGGRGVLKGYVLGYLRKSI